MEYEIKDYPKLRCPFIRSESYLATPILEPGYEWVFEAEGVKAVDKLHGTNICAIFEDGILQVVDNRANRALAAPCINANLTKGFTPLMLEGIVNAIAKGWIEPHFTGRIYGELVGPKINGNIHLLEKHYFVPFDYLLSSCHWKSWISNKYPKTYDAIREWFKDLPSLFTKKMTKRDALAEGVVFYHPDGRRAKLRRDHFGYKGYD